MKRLRATTILLAGFGVLAPMAGLAQTPDGQPPALRTGLGDYMTMIVQPRHIKLAIAGRRKNWTYAGYELGELQQSFDRIARSFPIRRKISVTETLRATTTEPMVALDNAIKNKDARAFAVAYGKLTDGCNACHRANEVPMVVIRNPADASFADQDFHPPHK